MHEYKINLHERFEFFCCKWFFSYQSFNSKISNVNVFIDRFLSSNKISQIDNNAFQGLSQLTIL